MIQLKSSEIQEVREEILESQGGVCDLCGEVIDEKSGISLDHQHKKKSETNGVDGAGLVRGVLCRSCNVMEGKVWNNMTRYLQPTCVQDRVEWLEKLIQYYKKENYPLIHPSEKPKEEIVSKRNYNKLAKVYKGRKKFPEYPKSGKLTMGLSVLFEEYEIPPYN